MSVWNFFGLFLCTTTFAACIWSTDHISWNFTSLTSQGFFENTDYDYYFSICQYSNLIPTCPPNFTAYQVNKSNGDCTGFGSLEGLSHESGDATTVYTHRYSYPLPQNQSLGQSVVIELVCSQKSQIMNVTMTEANLIAIWENPEACGAIRCEDVEAPTNGRMKCNENGNSCIMSCNEGFKMVGTPERICQPNGTWTDQPTCEAISWEDRSGTSCMFTAQNTFWNLASLSNLTFTYSDPRIDFKYHFTLCRNVAILPQADCPPGFVGYQTGNKDQKECYGLGSIEDSFYELGNTSTSYALRYSYPHGSKAFGLGERSLVIELVCSLSGQSEIRTVKQETLLIFTVVWETPEACGKPICNTAPNPIQNGMNTCDPFHSSCTASCNSGYYLTGSSVRTCPSNGSWVALGCEAISTVHSTPVLLPKWGISLVVIFGVASVMVLALIIYWCRRARRSDRTIPTSDPTEPKSTDSKDLLPHNDVPSDAESKTSIPPSSV